MVLRECKQGFRGNRKGCRLEKEKNLIDHIGGRGIHKQRENVNDKGWVYIEDREWGYSRLRKKER